MQKYTPECATIYALCDPDTEEIRYVGMSITPDYRYSQHVGNNRPKHHGMYEWIKELRAQNKRPGFKVLAEVPCEEARTAEEQWIHDLVKSGVPLLNIHKNPNAEKIWKVGDSSPVRTMGAYELSAVQSYIEAYDNYSEVREEVSRIGGAWVREVRGKISVRKFAVLLEVTPSFLSKVENGREPLSADLARKLLEFHEQNSPAK
jgi:hypothetical protein